MTRDSRRPSKNRSIEATEELEDIDSNYDYNKTCRNTFLWLAIRYSESQSEDSCRPSCYLNAKKLEA